MKYLFGSLNNYEIISIHQKNFKGKNFSEEKFFILLFQKKEIVGYVQYKANPYEQSIKFYSDFTIQKYNLFVMMIQKLNQHIENFNSGSSPIKKLDAPKEHLKNKQNVYKSPEKRVKEQSMPDEDSEKSI